VRTYTAILKYNDQLAGKVSAYYTLRQFGRSTVICVFLQVACMAVALYYGLEAEFFEIIGLSLAAGLGLYFWYRRETCRRWRDALASMGKPEARLTVDDDSFTVASGAGSSTIPWRRFSKLWKQGDYWLLFIDKNYMPMTLPLDGVDPDVLRLIEDKITETQKSTGS
jgi:YcxB-like protein